MGNKVVVTGPPIQNILFFYLSFSLFFASLELANSLLCLGEFFCDYQEKISLVKDISEFQSTDVCEIHVERILYCTCIAQMLIFLIELWCGIHYTM